jgi:hypothetical protein
MRKILPFAALFIAACSQTESPKVTHAKQLVAAKFVFPSSTRFRGVNTSSTGQVCGEANGRDLKDETGWRRFVVAGEMVQIQGKDLLMPYGETETQVAQQQDGLIASMCG